MKNNQTSQIVIVLAMLFIAVVGLIHMVIMAIDLINLPYRVDFSDVPKLFFIEFVVAMAALAVGHRVIKSIKA